MSEPVSVTFDIETNGFLDGSSIDYTSVPYKLKDHYKLHCIVVEWDGIIVGFHDGPKFVFDGRTHTTYNAAGEEIFVLEGYEPTDYIHRPLSAFKAFVDWLPEGSKVIGHNIINFDLLALKLLFDLDYKVEIDMGFSSPLGDDLWNGKLVEFDDTMVRSKTLNPDRYGGHSLDNLSQGLGTEKFDFRPSVAKELRFEDFGPDMVYYNIFDVKANKLVAEKLDKEMLEWGWGDKWNKAIKLEKATMELITRQEHRGFMFDMQLAEENIANLDRFLKERKEAIEPILPPRAATQAFMKNFTPPKVQFKKADGSPSANLLKFVDKIGAELVNDNTVMVFEGKEYPLPLKQIPLKTTMEATIDNTTHIKEWLVGEGWQPLEFKEKDITVDSKKNKLEGARLEATIERYCVQTENSNFWRDRVEHLGISARTQKEAGIKLRAFLKSRTERSKGGIRVLTNPSFTVGVEKEMCPNLLSFAEERKDLAVVLQITEYLTYRHRRNSILGGGADWDEDEEPEKGYLSFIREDGRIPTPADTCGAGTSRFRHRVVVNVPRSSSMFGKEMRGQFMADTSVAYLLGYDFSSLEARIEGHYCWEFEEGEDKGYCHSLTLEKPNDVHSVTARKIAEILGMNFGRTPAKSVKYASTYGGGVSKIAKIIGASQSVGTQVSEAFWEAAKPLAKKKESLARHWASFGKKKIVGLDGRLIPTRSEHALINSAFQSGGVICAKRVMVLHDREMNKKGLVVDFFKDSLYNRQHWAQQLIAMHDEAQMEVSKESVSFKRFDSEDSAREFKSIQAENGKIWSDIQESPKGGYFLAYCDAGQIISEVVNQVTKDFKLNVPLEAGYVLGNSWADTH